MVGTCVLGGAGGALHDRVCTTCFDAWAGQVWGQDCSSTSNDMHYMHALGSSWPAAHPLEYSLKPLL